MCIYIYITYIHALINKASEIDLFEDDETLGMMDGER